MMTFEAPGVAVDVDLEHGGRLSSLRIGEVEVLVTSANEAIGWGWYPMAPWAGRTRRGRFDCGGVEYQLPLHSDGHAIHGTVFQRPWHQDGLASWSTDLGPEWPFVGQVRQTLELSPGSLELTLELTSRRDEFPAAIGWHPWFRRLLGGVEAEIGLGAEFMLERDADGIATRTQVAVPDGPWDDCFGGLTKPTAVQWPGVLDINVESDCPYVVVFNGHGAGICVEPQTGPPDALNLGETLVSPPNPLRAWMRVSWRQPGQVRAPVA